MGNYFDIQDNPNDPPLRDYLIYAITGAVINPLSSLIGFIFFGLLDLLLIAVGIAPNTTFISIALGFIWIVPVCIIPQCLFGALTSFIIGLAYGKLKIGESKTPKQKLYFNLLAATMIGLTGPFIIYMIFFITGKITDIFKLSPL